MTGSRVLPRGKAVVVGSGVTEEFMAAAAWAAGEAEARGRPLVVVRAFDWHWPPMPIPTVPSVPADDGGEVSGRRCRSSCRGNPARARRSRRRRGGDRRASVARPAGLDHFGTGAHDTPACRGRPWCRTAFRSRSRPGKPRCRLSAVIAVGRCAARCPARSATGCSSTHAARSRCCGNSTTARTTSCEQSRELVGNPDVRKRSVTAAPGTAGRFVPLNEASRTTRRTR